LPFEKVVRMDEAAMDKLIAPDAVLKVLYEVRCIDDEGGRMARDFYLLSLLSFCLFLP